MSILKFIISLGAGLMTAFLSFKGLGNVMDDEQPNKSNVTNENQPRVDENGNYLPADPEDKSMKVIRCLDKAQANIINSARFVSDVIKSINLFVRAINYCNNDRNCSYGYSYNNY